MAKEKTLPTKKRKTILLKIDEELCYDVAKWLGRDEKGKLYPDIAEAVTIALRDYIRLRNAGESFDRAYFEIKEHDLTGEFLKPCPFCGYAPIMDSIESLGIPGVSQYKKIYTIRCSNPNCHGGKPSLRAREFKIAIMEWNTRFSENPYNGNK